MNSSKVHMGTYVFFTLLVLFSATGFGIAYAGESSVTNNVSFSVSTGNKTAEPGTRVIEGDAQSSISITTVIDGEVVEDIDTSHEGQPAESAEGQEYEYHAIHEEEGVHVETHISSNTSVGASSNYEVTTTSESVVPFLPEASAENNVDGGVTYQLFARINSFMTNLFTYVTQTFL